MKKPSEVFKNIRFAKLDPNHDKAGPFSTDDEEHGAVSEIEWNQQLKHQKHRAMQEKVDKPTGELKDACWKGYTAVGMKMKNGRKVPNCVPTNEVKDTKSMRIIKDLYKKKGVMKEEITIEEEIAGWIAHYNGQKHEIKKHEAKDLYDAKQKAIAHFKAPKSKHGLIAVKPAYNEAVETQPKSDHEKWKEEYKKARAAGSSSSNAKARANGAVYEEEQLDELSKDTLKSYRVKSIGRAGEFENRGYEAAKRGGAGSDKADKLFNKADAVTTARKRAQEKMREEVEQVEEGAFKRIATDAEEDKRLGSWKKETPWMKSKDVVTDKSGAKHTPMSRARDLARKAAQKNVKESFVAESRLADIVKEAAEKAKKKKKEKASDTFQKDPELSTQIIRND